MPHRCRLLLYSCEGSCMPGPEPLRHPGQSLRGGAGGRNLSPPPLITNVLPGGNNSDVFGYTTAHQWTGWDRGRHQGRRLRSRQCSRAGGRRRRRQRRAWLRCGCGNSSPPLPLPFFLSLPLFPGFQDPHLPPIYYARGFPPAAAPDTTKQQHLVAHVTFLRPSHSPHWRRSLPIFPGACRKARDQCCSSLPKPACALPPAAAAARLQA